MIIGGWRGPGWQVFDADPRLGREIRDWIRSAISGHDCPVDAADAALVATELFGNAVTHGCVRLYNSSITKLFRKISVGVPVAIH